ncbi:MAG: hypothetical protein WC223_08960, partial [Bacteroidales bacterium]
MQTFNINKMGNLIKIACLTLVFSYAFSVKHAFSAKPAYMATVTPYDYTYLNTHSTITVTVDKITQSAYQQTRVKSRKLSLKLDMGDIYELGNLKPWSCSLNVSIDAYDAQNNKIRAFTPSIFAIDKDRPEKIIEIDYTNIANITSYFIITKNSFQCNESFAQSKLRLLIGKNNDICFGLYQNNSSQANNEIIPSISSVSASGFNINEQTGSNAEAVEIQFEWNLPMNSDNDMYFDSYDLQVLKVEADETGSVEIKWEKASTIEVERGQKTYKMTLTEGTGFYFWRVRAVGSYYEGGRSNYLNYGSWTTQTTIPPSNLFTPPNTSIPISLSPANVPVAIVNNSYLVNVHTTNPPNPITYSNNDNCYFYYNQFNDNFNWIHGRVYTENSQKSETMSFANGLNQLFQKQTKLFSQGASGSVLATQTVYDFSGRAAVNSLVAPVNDSYFGYKSNFFNTTSSGSSWLFNANNFDADANLYTNTPLATDAGVNFYYSDNNLTLGNKAKYIPDAKGFPYTRTLFYNDASGRPLKQGLAGDVLNLKADGHNTTIQYDAVSQTELDRVFGNEAPLWNSTYQVKTTDPNGVVTTNYMAKAGQVLATIVSAPTIPANLDISTCSRNPEHVFQPFEVKSSLPSSTYSALDNKSTTFTSLIIEADEDHFFNPETLKVKKVNVDYKISPKTFGDNCGPIICETCDYTVEITITCPLSPNDNRRNMKLLIKIPPHACPATGDIELKTLPAGVTYQLTAIDGTTLASNFTNFVTTGEIYLPSGSYNITKNVYTNNNEPAPSTIRYLDDYKQQLSNIADSWVDQYNESNIVWDIPNIAGHLTLNPSCCTISVNTSGYDCSLAAPSCTDADLDKLYNTYIAPCTLSTVTLVPLTTFKNHVNDLITNHGYTCDQIYQCAVSVFNLYTLNESFNSNHPGSNPDAWETQYKSDFDVIATLDECLGYNLTCSNYQNISILNENRETDGSISSTYWANNVNNIKIYWADADWYNSASNCNLPSIPAGETAYRIFGSEDNNSCPNLFADNDPSTSIYNTTTLENNINTVTKQDICYKTFNINTAPPTLSSAEKAKWAAQGFCKCVHTDPPPAGTQINLPAVCEEGCENSRPAFEGAIDNFVTEFNHSKGLSYTGQTSVIGGQTVTWLTFDEIFINYDCSSCPKANLKECFVDAMVAQCKLQCQMPVSTQVFKDVTDPAKNNPTDNYTIVFTDGTPSIPTGMIYMTYVQSDDFKAILKSEQLEYEKAFMWVPKFAPVAETPSVSPINISGYSDVGDANLVKDQIIDFINTSLDRGLQQKRTTVQCGNQLIATGYDYVFESTLPTTGGVNYNQEKQDFVLQTATAPNVYKKITVVTNVVSYKDDCVYPTTPGNDKLIEVNVAFYCTGQSPAIPIATWVLTNDATTGYPGFDNFSNNFKLSSSSFVKFFFDQNDILHAVPQPYILQPQCSLYVSPNYFNTSDFLTDFIVDVPNTTTFPNKTNLQLTIKSSTDNVFKQLTTTINKTTDADIANEIANQVNIDYNIPNFTASVDANNKVTISVPTNFTGDYSQLYIWATSGSASTSAVTINPNTTTTFTPFCSWYAACSSYTETTANICPFDYFHLSHSVTQNPSILIDNTSTTHNNLLNEIVSSFKSEVNDIVKNDNSITHNTNFIDITTDYNPSNYYFREIEKDVYISDGTSTGSKVKLYVTAVSAKDNLGAVQPGYCAFYFHIIRCDCILPVMSAKFGGDNPNINWAANASGSTSPVDEMFTFSVTPASTTGCLSSSLIIEQKNYQGVPIGGLIVYLGSLSASEDDNNSAECGGYSFAAAGSNYSCNCNVSVGANTTNSPARIETFNGLSLVLARSLCKCSIPVDNTTTCNLCMAWEKMKPVKTEFITHPLTCNELKSEYILSQFMSQIQTCKENLIKSITDSYTSNCLANITDEFTYSYNLDYSYYTLYYYDRANNLIRTVSPEDVDILNKTGMDAAMAYRNAISSVPPSPTPPAPVYPAHIATTYEYNSIKQVVKQNTPDGGETRFWYNAKGQIILSQNDFQKNQTGNYSYSVYDALGRIIESGELTPATTSGFTISDPNELAVPEIWSPQTNSNASIFPYSNFDSKILAVGIASVSEVTRTIYSNRAKDPDAISNDISYPVMYKPTDMTAMYQENLRNRVSYVYRDEDGDGNPESYTFYSYDPHGNVEWLIQQLPGIGKNYLRYEYDLVSDKVTRFIYDENFNTQFMHRYEYDADNRILAAYTSKEGITWERDASYEYYLHGPLSREEIGKDKIQGIDYTYNINGYLKAINQPELYSLKDPGADFASASSNEKVLPDEFGMELGYYKNDYHRTGSEIGETNTFDPYNTILLNTNDAAQHQLYNGNISYWTSNIRAGSHVAGPFGTIQLGMKTNIYRYDILNRIKSSTLHEYVSGTGVPVDPGAGDVIGNPLLASWAQTSDYSENFTYDANGNILTLTRNAYPVGIIPSNEMDKFRYIYDNLLVLPDGNHIVQNNKLFSVADDAGTSDFKVDIQSGQPAINYAYDDIGRLVSDNQEGISYINWNNINKVVCVTKYPKDNNVIDYSKVYFLIYHYDALGNRIMKSETEKVNTPFTGDYKTLQTTETTWYVYDPTGNPIAIYDRTAGNTATKVTLSEAPIYGSKRIGVFKPTGVEVLNESSYVPETTACQKQSNIGADPVSDVQTITQTEYRHWLASTNQKQLSTFKYTNPFVSVDFDNNADVSTNDLKNLPPTNFAGYDAGKCIATAEDQYGNVQFRFVSVKYFSGGQQYILLDKDNNPSFKGNIYFNASSDMPAIAMKMPNFNGLYYLITGDKSGVYYHVIDAINKTVTSANNSIITASPNEITKLAFAGYNDLTGSSTPNKLYIFYQHNGWESSIIGNNNCPACLPLLMLKNYTYIKQAQANVSDLTNNLITLASTETVLKIENSSPSKKLTLNQAQISPNGSTLAVTYGGYNLYGTGQSGSGAVTSIFYITEPGSNIHPFESITASNIASAAGYIQNNIGNPALIASAIPSIDAIGYYNNFAAQPAWPPVPFANANIGHIVSLYPLSNGSINGTPYNIVLRRENYIGEDYRTLSFDFSKNSNYLCYAEKQLIVPGATSVLLKRMNLTTKAIETLDTYTSNSQGNAEVRRAYNNKLYVNNASNVTSLYVYNNIDNTSITQEASLDLQNGSCSGGLPLQPYRKYGLLTLLPAPIVSQRKIGDKFYELTDHLGNVHVVVSDKRLAVDDGTYAGGVKQNSTLDGIIDYYTADVQAFYDYYGGVGMVM